MGKKFAQFKCPQCGESKLLEFNPGEYKCQICGTIIKDDRIAEILDILKSNPDNFIGNLKFRLNNELKQKQLDIDVLKDLACKILELDPEDFFASFIRRYCDRKKYHSEYKECLRQLSESKFEPYLQKQIANLLVSHYEGNYKDLIISFLNNASLYDEYEEALNEQIQKATDEINLKDPFLKRDVFIICNDDDFNDVTKLFDYFESKDLLCWFEPVNLDYDLNREEQILNASKNSTLTIIMNSKTFKENRDLRFEANKVIQEVYDEELTKYNLDNVIVYNLNNPIECDRSLLSLKSYDMDKLNIEEFYDVVVDHLYKLNNKEDYVNKSKINEAVSLRKKGYNKKALHILDDLLDEDLEANDEKDARVEALRCLIALDESNSEKAYNHVFRIKKLASADDLAKYEDEFPILIDEKEVYKKGIEYYSRKDFENAYKCFNKSASKNYPDALNKLGEMHFLGKGVDVDIEKAVNYYSLAASLNCVDSMRMLGAMYLMGNKVEKDEYKAFKYLLNGADNKNAFCALKVGICYQEGIGTVKDDNKAFEYLKFAAINELPEACRLLGKCFKYGLGTKTNREYAIRCFEFAAKNGDYEARRELMFY